jgi:DNA mismatch repair protein MutL
VVGRTLVETEHSQLYLSPLDGLNLPSACRKFSLIRVNRARVGVTVSQIRILPENIANQIAAGEVVERPASVVKELVENALDAGATSVEIYVEGDGSRLIRVIDNGRGMDEDDVLLCLERHATSKIREERDLAAIRTLGFRGEALPSIASVSRLTITSRPFQSELGTRVEVRYGTVTKVHEMGVGFGTVVEVRQLFGNLPARRKFLKTPRTELAHIEELLLSFALIHADKGFLYVVDGRTVWQMPTASDSLAFRMQRLSGNKGGTPFVSLHVEQLAASSPPPITISGYLFPPDGDCWPGSKLRLFLNDRVVKDRMMVQAVVDGGEGYYMKGRRPAGAVLIDIDPSLVDVNVHPTKQEVRFRRPSAVFAAISDAVRRGLTDFQHGLSRHLFGPRKEPSAKPASVPRRQSLVGSSSYKGQEEKVFLSGSPQQVREPQKLFGPSPSSIPPQEQIEAICSVGNREEKKGAASVGWESNLVKEKQDRDGGLAAMQVIGQLLDSFLLCQDGEHLLVIDQHAAQERLLYEKLVRQHETGGLARQILLFPVLLELDAGELQLVEQFAGQIERLGFDVQHFGGESILIKAVPSLLGDIEPETLLRSLMERFSKERGMKGRKPVDRVEEVFARLACKAAVKANHRLQPQEMKELLRQMQEADVFSHCPHGRPVFRRFSRNEIDRWFFRT